MLPFMASSQPVRVEQQVGLTKVAGSRNSLTAGYEAAGSPASLTSLTPSPRGVNTATLTRHRSPRTLKPVTWS